MRDSSSEEITLELLSDLQKAIEEVTKTILPQLRADVRVIKEPYLGIVIRVDKDATSEFYPNFITARAHLRPTKYGRNILGLREE